MLFFFFFSTGYFSLLYDQMSSARVSAASAAGQQKVIREAAKDYSVRGKGKRSVFSALHTECISTGSGVLAAVSSEKTVQGSKFADLDFSIQPVTVCETLGSFIYILSRSRSKHFLKSRPFFSFMIFFSVM